mgnify:FL=1
MVTPLSVFARLKEHQQAYFVGIRSTFYRIAMITGQGLLIILAGFFETSTGLKPIEITVDANPAYSQSVVIPENRLSNDESDGKSYFMTLPQQVQGSTENIAVERLDSIRRFISNHNQTNGFVHHSNAGQSSKQNKENGSLWSNYVSEPLTVFLKKHFQSEKPVADAKSLTGNVTVVAIRLSSPPQKGKEMVLNTKFSNGDNSIKLIEGERFTFNNTNWDKPAYLLFQVDHKLNRASQATFKGTSGNIHLAWSITFLILAGLFVIFFFYHRFILPYPLTDKQAERQQGNLFKDFFETFGSFFRRKDIGIVLSFLLLYRFGEAQLVKMASPFMLDSRAVGGLGLTTGDVGLLYGTFGILSLTAGGILGGIAASRKGLKFWLWWMVMAINLPHMAYVYLAYFQPENQLIIGLCAAIEQFSYGFGFTAYMLYMIYISEGEHKTAHFAIATGFMALGMMIPGMFSGWLQEIIGYKYFFVWIMLCMIPAVIPVLFVKVKPEFGIKKKEN